MFQYIYTYFHLPSQRNLPLMIRFLIIFFLFLAYSIEGRVVNELMDKIF